MVMEPEYYAFRRWLDNLCSSSENITGFLLLMAEILHQLMGSFPHYLCGFIHPRWLFGISSINSRDGYQVPHLIVWSYRNRGIWWLSRRSKAWSTSLASRWRTMGDLAVTAGRLPREQPVTDPVVPIVSTMGTHGNPSFLGVITVISPIY